MFEMQDIPKKNFFACSYHMNICLIGDYANSLYIFDIENLRCIE
jgi:hypothetical protein